MMVLIVGQDTGFELPDRTTSICWDSVLLYYIIFKEAIMKILKALWNYQPS